MPDAILRTSPSVGFDVALTSWTGFKADVYLFAAAGQGSGVFLQRAPYAIVTTAGEPPPDPPTTSVKMMPTGVSWAW